MQEAVAARSFSVSQFLSKIFASRFMTYVLLVIILIMGGMFRFTELDWDEEQHLHPDERFLTMVSSDIEWPKSFKNYFDPTTSELSPYAQNPEVWYVYGTLPIYIVKWVAVTLDMDGYGKIYLVGRAMSGVFDLGCILFIFLIGQRLYNDRVALLAAALYALAAHPIQLSHFFAVDTFANFFVAMTFYWSVRASEHGNWWYYLLMGISLGAGIASKLSVLTLGIVVVMVGVLDFTRFYQRRKDTHSALEHIAVRWATVGFCMLLTFRLLQPIAFEGPGFFNFALFDKWKADIDQMKLLVEGEIDTPPFVQWTDRTPLWFPWKNMVIWGLGLPLGITAWAGWLLGVYELIRYRRLAHLLPVIYIAAAFLYHGTQWVTYMRYFMPIYPLLALMAGYAIFWLWQKVVEASRAPRTNPQVPATALRWGTALITLVVVGGTFLYAVAFTSIYTRTNSRIEASRWIYETVPHGSIVANEHWDDSIPLRIDGKDGFFNWYTDVKMNNYDHYSPEKLDMIVNNLTQVDYVFLTSNRLYGSITRIPIRYPIATRYYELLFAEQLGFKKVAEFTSYPQIFGIQFPDQSADESFTVYDHPKVTIFEKTDDFHPSRVRTRLTKDIDWYTYIHLKPKQATEAPTGLMFLKEDREIYQQAGTWSDIFQRESIANKFPIAVWIIIIQLIGWLAFPLLFVAFPRLYDRGYLLAKAAGLLIIGWIVWMMASLHWLRFSPASIVLALLLLALGAALVIGVRYRELVSFVRANMRFLLLAEGLFWLVFAFGMILRWQNPDLWHNIGDSEKHMSGAYLNAIIKSPYFPPYDPWFSGGFINYPYFGLLLVAIVAKFSGIIPAIAYNLAVPTFFAMTASAAFALGFNIVEGWRESRSHLRSDTIQRPALPQAIVVGVIAILFVMIIGNLGHVESLLKGETTFLSHQEAVRIVPEDGEEPELKAIFPFFTFLQADLTAELAGLPYFVMVMALLVNSIREMPKSDDREHDYGESEQSLRSRLLALAKDEGLSLLILALALGALTPINMPSGTIALMMTGAVFVIQAYHRQKARAQQQSLSPNPARASIDIVMIGWNAFWRFGFVLIVGKVLYAPFDATYANIVTGIELWTGTRLPFTVYLGLYGFLIFINLSYLVLELIRPGGQNAIVRLIRLLVRHWQRLGRLGHLHNRLVRPSVWYDLAIYATLFVTLFILLLLVIKQFVLAMALLMLMMSLLLMIRRDAIAREHITLALIALGCILTIGVQLFVFKGEGDNMENSFRVQMVAFVTLHIWVVWGLAAATTLFVMATRLTSSSIAKTSATKKAGIFSAVMHSIRQVTVRSIGIAWWAVFVLLLMMSLHYPIFGSIVRLTSRLNVESASSLDGMVYMNQANHFSHGFEFGLGWDMQALLWMQQNIPGSPVIVEATRIGEGWTGRVSAYTGLPTILGQELAQRYQRAILPNQAIHDRIRDVDTIYNEPDPDVTYTILQEHNVQYIYVGPLEKALYGDAGIAKFADHEGDYWGNVYENSEVVIYQVY